MSAALLPEIDDITVSDIMRLAQATRTSYTQECAADPSKRTLSHRRTSFLSAWQVIADARPHLADYREHFLKAGGVA